MGFCIISFHEAEFYGFFVFKNKHERVFWGGGSFCMLWMWNWSFFQSTFLEWPSVILLDF